jgi:hypothetical protein
MSEIMPRGFKWTGIGERSTMFTRRTYVSGVVAAIAFGVVGAGCETAGLDSLPNVGITDAFAGKKAPEPDLKENPPLKIPPTNATLPVPGQQAAQSQWTPAADSDPSKKQKSGT